MDLKLPQDTNGADVLKRLQELYLRIPVVIFSGTPSELDEEYKSVCLESLVKGEQPYSDILDLLWDCKRTGLMELIGGKGLFEQYLKTVFDNCIVPRFDEWREALKNFDATEAAQKTQAALSRHILSCLYAMLHQDEVLFQPEECYLRLPDESISSPRPGMILESNTHGRFLVLNPACDLVIREDGHANVDVMVLVPIDSELETLKSLMQTNENGTALTSRQKTHNKKVREAAFKNSDSIRFHWLPTCGKFQGGFVNFRNVMTCPCTQFGQEYHTIESKYVVHPDVLKNIQSRFANYYARQGQPAIDFDRFISKPIAGYIG